MEAQKADTTLKHLLFWIKDRSFNLLKMKVAYAIKVGSQYQSHCNGVQRYGITTIFSTLGIPVLRRQ